MDNGNQGSVEVMLSERAGQRSIQLGAILETLGICSLGRKRRLRRKKMIINTGPVNKASLGKSDDSQKE